MGPQTRHCPEDLDPFSIKSAFFFKNQLTSTLPRYSCIVRINDKLRPLYYTVERLDSLVNIKYRKLYVGGTSFHPSCSGGHDQPGQPSEALSQESKWKCSSCKRGCLDPTVERSFMVQTAEPKDDASFGQNCKS